MFRIIIRWYSQRGKFPQLTAKDIPDWTEFRKLYLARGIKILNTKYQKQNTKFRFETAEDCLRTRKLLDELKIEIKIF